MLVNSIIGLIFLIKKKFYRILTFLKHMPLEHLGSIFGKLITAFIAGRKKKRERRRENSHRQFTPQMPTVIGA